MAGKDGDTLSGSVSDGTFSGTNTSVSEDKYA